MTSTEFAAKYRLLKNVATHGARSFLAQQVQLGRMVMVHYLDSETIDQRAATLARLEALRPPARDKLLEIADVDGTPVAVTLFISSFKDFATWLDSLPAPTAEPRRIVAAPSAPGEFTREFNKTEPAAAPLIPAGNAVSAEPARKQEAPKKTAGEFTRIFGKLDEPVSSDLPDNASGAPATRDENTIPTVLMEAVRPPHAPPPVSSNGHSSAASESGSGFTAIFGSRGGAPHAAPDLSLSSPVAAPSPSQVLPPLPAAMDPRPTTPSRVPQPAAADQPGEFTQLFQHLSSGAGASSTPFAAAPPPPELQRPIAPTPRADAPPAPPSVPPLGAPALGSSLGASLAGPAFAGITPPSSLPPFGAAPLSGGVGAVLPAPSLASGAPAASANGPKPSDLNPPLPNLGGLPNAAPVLPASGGGSHPPVWGAPAPTPAAPAIGASFFGSAPPSEFTRILSPIAAPAPPVPIQPPTSAAPAAAGSSRKSMLPLIIGLAAVVVLTMAIVLYFVLRK